MRETLRGSNLLGEAKLDALRLHELEQTFAVSAGIAIDFGQCWKVFAFGLSDVKNVDGTESVHCPLTLTCCVFASLVGRYILRISSSDHRSENENAFFSTPDEAAKRSPSPVSGNVSSIWLLPRNEHDVAEASCHRPDYVNSPLRDCSPFP